MSDKTGADRTGMPLELLDQLDRICDQFERGWRSERVARIEDYLGAYIAEAYRPALLDLLAAELDARRRLGERPGPREYADRFPRLAEEVEAAFTATRVQPVGGTPFVTEHGLLFGLLALQTGLVDQTSLGRRPPRVVRREGPGHRRRLHTAGLPRCAAGAPS